MTNTLRHLGRAFSAGVATILIFLIRAYQSIHIAFFRGSCRFHPTCSHYALEAIELHGPGRGILLTVWRVLRCQPFCRGGFDLVPEAKQKQTGRTLKVAEAEHFKVILAGESAGRAFGHRGAL